MEEKKSLKISLSTLLFFLAIIVIVVMGYFIYKFYNEKTTATEEITNLNNQISSLESTVNRLQETINNVSNTINNSQSNNTETSDNKYTKITDNLEGIDVLYVTNVVNNNNTCTLIGLLYTQYTLSHAELQQIINKGSMKINNENYIIKNSETSNEYDLYESNAEFPLYKIKQTNSNNYYLEAQAQISDVWKLTNEYKEITVSSDTKCSMVFDYEEKYNTVEDVFKNFNETEPLETINPDADKTFTFKFENGKCVEVINVLTSV